jgi:hypothetical protein
MCTSLSEVNPRGGIVPEVEHEPPLHNARPLDTLTICTCVTLGRCNASRAISSALSACTLPGRRRERCTATLTRFRGSYIETNQGGARLGVSATLRPR